MAERGGKELGRHLGGLDRHKRNFVQLTSNIATSAAKIESSLVSMAVVATSVQGKSLKAQQASFVNNLDGTVRQEDDLLCWHDWDVSSGYYRLVGSDRRSSEWCVRKTRASDV